MSGFNLEEFEDISGDGGLLKKIIQQGEGGKKTFFSFHFFFILFCTSFVLFTSFD